MRTATKWVVGGLAGFAVMGGVLSACGSPEPGPVAAAPAVAAPSAPSPAPAPPAPDPVALDDGARAACDSLAYDLRDVGGSPDALAAVDVERWGVMVRQYLSELGDSGNVLIRDSAEVLTNVAAANPSARVLALDTAAGRCFDAGWEPN